MSREFDHLTDADMKALALARDMGIMIGQSSSSDSQDSITSHLPRNSARPIKEVATRKITDPDGKIWIAKDAGQFFAQSSFVDRDHR